MTTEKHTELETGVEKNIGPHMPFYVLVDTSELSGGGEYGRFVDYEMIHPDGSVTAGQGWQVGSTDYQAGMRSALESVNMLGIIDATAEDGRLEMRVVTNGHKPTKVKIAEKGVKGQVQAVFDAANIMNHGTPTKEEYLKLYATEN
jgi:hypothetical protein